MDRRDDELFEELAVLASNIGPSLAPVGHEELLEAITAAAMRIFDAAACSLALLDERQEFLVFEIASGSGAEAVRGMRVPVGHGIAGWVITSGQPIALQDVASDPRFARDVADTTGYVPRSILAMPLETEREMLGVISVLDSGEERQAAADLELLSVFARLAALAIESSRVFGDLGRTLLRAAAEAAEEGDLSTALKRTADKAPGPDRDLLEVARCFHELGQVGPTERQAVARLAQDFLDYVRRRDRRW